MKKVPPIPTAATGPLGLVQLPRLWSKVLLDAKGLLPEGYVVCSQGFDRILLDGLGLSQEEVVAYLREHLPTYLAFERWIVSRRGPVSVDTRERINREILSRMPREERRQQMLASLGLPPDSPPMTMVELNTLDDWQEFHRYLVEG